MSWLLPIFRWFDKSSVGQLINDTNWLFPGIEAVHIVALALLFGAILILNLRLFGLVLRTKPVPELARELAPWTLCSLIIILISGVLLFSSEAMKSYASVPFQLKMVFLFAAILFHYTFYRKLTQKDESRVNAIWSRTAAVVSVLLWLGVGVGGRAIGFF
jgi:hypothetical protein